MQFTYPITILPNTPEDNPIRLNCLLNRGTLDKVSVYFPWGCAGAVGVRIFHYEHVLYPTNPDKWFTGNEILIEFNCAYDVEQGWDLFHLEGYNECDFYPHTPIVSFVILPTTGVFRPPVAWVEG